MVNLLLTKVVFTLCIHRLSLRYETLHLEEQVLKILNQLQQSQ